MAIYVKKRIEVEPEQYIIKGKLVRGMCGLSRCFSFSDQHPHVHTIHSHQCVVVKVGDWIIPEVDGKHFYPCNPEIFNLTYEMVSEE